MTGLVPWIAVGAGLVTLLGFSPVKRVILYVYNRLWSEPRTERHRAEIREEVTEVIESTLKRPNGGASLSDLAAELKKVRATQAMQIERLQELGRKADAAVEKADQAVGRAELAAASIQVFIDAVGNDDLPPPR